MEVKENCTWNRRLSHGDRHGFVFARGRCFVCVGWGGIMGSFAILPRGFDWSWGSGLFSSGSGRGWVRSVGSSTMTSMVKFWHWIDLAVTWGGIAADGGYLHVIEAQG